MKALLFPLLLLSFLLLISSEQVEPQQYPKILSYAKDACQEKAGEYFRFAKCIDMNKMIVQNGIQYAITVLYIDRAGMQKYFELNIYENPYWDNALTLNDIEEH